MKYVARQVSEARWKPKKPITGERGIRADAISELKTTNDTLSFWICDNTRESVAETVLALVVGSKSIETIDMVLLGKSELERRGFVFKTEPGVTILQDEEIKKRHLNIVNLDLIKLSKLARSIATKIRNQKNKNILVFKFTKPEILKMIDNAVKEGGIEEGRLQETVKLDLKMYRDALENA